jgi:hypothetical protein
MSPRRLIMEFEQRNTAKDGTLGLYFRSRAHQTLRIKQAALARPYNLMPNGLRL